MDSGTSCPNARNPGFDTDECKKHLHRIEYVMRWKALLVSVGRLYVDSFKLTD